MKRLLTIILIVFMLFSIVACSSTTSPAVSTDNVSNEANANSTAESKQIIPDSITIATGNTGGTFYYIGAGQAKILTETVPSSSFSVEATSTGIENVVYTHESEDTLGIAGLDYMFAGFNGDTHYGFDKANDNIRLLMVGHSTSVHYVVLEDSPIKTFYDIKGKKIGLPPQSSGYYLSERLFKEYGISLDDIQVVFVSTSEAGDALKDGTIDLAVYSGGAPIAAVTDLDTTKRIRFISFDEKEVQDSFFKKYPFYYPSVIKAGIYKGAKQDVNVANFPISLACNKDLDDDFVYEIVKSLDQNVDKLLEIHPLGKHWCAKTTFDYLKEPVIPFHDGALKYYNEINK